MEAVSLEELRPLACSTMKAVVPTKPVTSATGTVEPVHVKIVLPRDLSVLQVTPSLPLVLTFTSSGVLLGDVVLLIKRLALYVAAGVSTLQSNRTSVPTG